MKTLIKVAMLTPRERIPGSGKYRTPSTREQLMKAKQNPKLWRLNANKAIAQRAGR